MSSRRSRRTSGATSNPSTSSATLARSRKFRPGGGSFDFLQGAYAESRGAARRRLWAIVAGASILVLTGIFTGYQVMSRSITQEEVQRVAADYNQAAADYQSKTGKQPQTRSQLAAQLRSQSQALQLAATSSVDVDWLLARINAVLPADSQVVALTVKSWQPAPDSAASPAASAAPADPGWAVAFSVNLPSGSVSALEANVKNLPFYQSQSSKTDYNVEPGRAQTQVTVVSKSPLSSPKIRKLAEGG